MVAIVSNLALSQPKLRERVYYNLCYDLQILALIIHNAMGKYKIYITRQIPKHGIEFLLQNNCELTFWESDEAIPHGQLTKNIAGDKYDGILCMLTDNIDIAVLNAAGTPNML